MSPAVTPSDPAIPDEGIDAFVQVLLEHAEAYVSGGKWQVAVSLESADSPILAALTAAAPLIGRAWAAAEREAVLREIEAEVCKGEAGASPWQHLTYVGGLRKAGRIVAARGGEAQR